MTEGSIDQYLDALFHLERQSRPVSTTALAETLDVSPASVSEMLRKLDGRGLVNHTPYHGVTLTAEGLRRAALLSRRHSLWEIFLTEYLGIPLDEVYEEACLLEHATSSEVAERLMAFLENPQVCPHGVPIPSINGAVSGPSLTPLSTLVVGARARIARIREDNHRDLQRLVEMGLVPGAEITVIAVNTSAAEMLVEIGGSMRSVPLDLAKTTQVELAAA